MTARGGHIAALVPAPPNRWAVHSDVAYVVGRERAYPTGEHPWTERVDYFAIVEVEGRYGVEQHVEPVITDEGNIRRPASEVSSFAALVDAESGQAALAAFDPTTCALPSPVLVTAFNVEERLLQCAVCHARRTFPRGLMTVGKEDGLAVCSDCAAEINEADLVRR
jgi:hypothetical protein